LAGGVPNLSLDFLGVDLQALSLELDAYGGLGVHIELVAGVAGKEVGFSDRRVSDYDDLEEVLFSSFVIGTPHFELYFLSAPRKREETEKGLVCESGCFAVMILHTTWHPQAPFLYSPAFIAHLAPLLSFFKSNSNYYYYS